MAERDWPRARALWEEARKADPENPWHRFWYANARARTGEGEACIAELRSLLSEGFSPNIVRVCMIERLLDMQRGDAALSVLKDLLASGFDDEKAIYRLVTWIIRIQTSAPGFPRSVFSLDQCLLSRVRFNAG